MDKITESRQRVPEIKKRQETDPGLAAKFLQLDLQQVPRLLRGRLSQILDPKSKTAYLQMGIQALKIELTDKGQTLKILGQHAGLIGRFGADKPRWYYYNHLDAKRGYVGGDVGQHENFSWYAVELLARDPVDPSRYEAPPKMALQRADGPHVRIALSFFIEGLKKSREFRGIREDMQIFFEEWERQNAETDAAIAATMKKLKDTLKRPLSNSDGGFPYAFVGGVTLLTILAFYALYKVNRRYNIIQVKYG